MAFKDMLKFFREREGLSQNELAKKLGLSTSTISMYEVGKREPDFETEEKIADFFNTDLNTLRGRDIEPMPNELLPTEYAKKYAKLDDPGKYVVHLAIDNEYEKKEHLLNEYNRVMKLEKIINIEDAKIILGNAAAFGGYATDEELINMANIVLQSRKK